MIALVYESYIPRVRYGAAMALGIACAGTGSREAMAIIEPMCNDTVSYVRRAALIASALIMIQHTEVTCPKVKEFRAMYAKIIADKHEDVMVKLGMHDFFPSNHSHLTNFLTIILLVKSQSAMIFLFEFQVPFLLKELLMLEDAMLPFVCNLELGTLT